MVHGNYNGREDHFPLVLCLFYCMSLVYCFFEDEAFEEQEDSFHFGFPVIVWTTLFAALILSKDLRHVFVGRLGYHGAIFCEFLLHIGVAVCLIETDVGSYKKAWVELFLLRSCALLTASVHLLLACCWICSSLHPHVVHAWILLLSWQKALKKTLQKNWMKKWKKTWKIRVGVALFMSFLVWEGP